MASNAFQHHRLNEEQDLLVWLPQHVNEHCCLATNGPWHVALQSFQAQRRLPRPIPLLTNKESTERIHRHAQDETNSFDTDPDVHGIDVFCCVLGQCLCQSAWMDGATLCSWLFVCECAHVHQYTKYQRFETFLISTQMRFHKIDFVMKKKTAQT